MDLWTQWANCELDLGQDSIYYLILINTFSSWINDGILGIQIIVLTGTLCPIVLEMTGSFPSTGAQLME